MEQHDMHVKAQAFVLWAEETTHIALENARIDEEMKAEKERLANRTPEQIKEDERIDAMEKAADAALDRHMQMAENRHFEIIGGDLDPQEPEWY
tara:strand:- start:792 stop:1073 length:282 start_codon:yes stop_codon:yes gene_type:complete